MIMVAQQLDSSDDARLVSASQKGYQSAFECLVKRHQSMMLNIAFRMVNNYDDACDITQDSFLAAWRKIADFRGEARFSTWLPTIVINLSRTKLQQIRTNAGRYACSLNSPLPGTDSLPDPPSGTPSAHEQMEQAELRKAVQGCIGTLQPEFREVLILRDMQGLSYEEVSSSLGVKDGTVKSRLFRAREGVKDCLKGILR